MKDFNTEVAYSQCHGMGLHVPVANMLNSASSISRMYLFKLRFYRALGYLVVLSVAYDTEAKTKITGVHPQSYYWCTVHSRFCHFFQKVWK